MTPTEEKYVHLLSQLNALVLEMKTHSALKENEAARSPFMEQLTGEATGWREAAEKLDTIIKDELT